MPSPAPTRRGWKARRSVRRPSRRCRGIERLDIVGHVSSLRARQSPKPRNGKERGDGGGPAGVETFFREDGHAAEAGVEHHEAVARKNLKRAYREKFSRPFASSPDACHRSQQGVQDQQLRSRVVFNVNDAQPAEGDVAHAAEGQVGAGDDFHPHVDPGAVRSRSPWPPVRGSVGGASREQELPHGDCASQWEGGMRLPPTTDGPETAG